MSDAQNNAPSEPKDLGDIVREVQATRLKVIQENAYTLKLAQMWLADGYLKQANDVLRNALGAAGWTPCKVKWVHTGHRPIPLDQDALIEAEGFKSYWLDLRLCGKRIAAIPQFVWYCRGATGYELQVGKLCLRWLYLSFWCRRNGSPLQVEWAGKD